MKKQLLVTVGVVTLLVSPTHAQAPLTFEAESGMAASFINADKTSQWLAVMQPVKTALATSDDHLDTVVTSDSPSRDEFEKTPSKGLLFRAGLVGGLGVEYIRDVHETWQGAFHAATWVLFSEVGTDIRYFLKQVSNAGYYVGSGFRLLNSPLLFDLALGYNVEVGFEKRKTNGSYFGAGVGGTLLYIPDGISAEAHGFEGVVPSITVRVGKIRRTR